MVEDSAMGTSGFGSVSTSVTGGDHARDVTPWTPFAQHAKCRATIRAARAGDEHLVGGV